MDVGRFFLRMNPTLSRLVALALLLFLPSLNAREPQTSPPSATTPSARARSAFPSTARRRVQRHHRRRRRRGRLHHSHQRRRQARSRERAGAHRCYGDPSARPDSFDDPVYAGVFQPQRQRRDDRHRLDRESGFLEGPVMITNTHSVGVVRDAIDRLAGGQAAPIRPGSPGACRSWRKRGTAT